STHRTPRDPPNALSLASLSGAGLRGAYIVPPAVSVFGGPRSPLATSGRSGAVARSGLPTQKNPAHSVTSDWAGFSVPRRTASKQRTRSATLAPLDIRPRIRA